MPSLTPTRPDARSRTIEPTRVPERGIALPESWLRGFLAGAEGLLGTWILVIVPVIAVYVATAASPDLGSASWLEAVGLGTGIWALAHGAAFEVGESTISLMPLGITLMAFFLTTTAIRRAALATWAGIAIAIGTYIAGAALLVQFTDAPGAGRAIIGAIIIAVAAALFATRTHRPRTPERMREFLTAARDRWDTWLDEQSRTDLARIAGITLRSAWTAAGRTLLAIGATATLAVGLALAFGFPLVRAVHDELNLDWVSTVAFIGGQILLLPILIVWAASYLSGAGFTFGEGTLYSPAEVISAPLPAVPILGALPNPENPRLTLLGFTFLALGFLAGWLLHRRLRQISDDEVHLAASLASAFITGALIVAGVTIAATLATGGIGPGRFASGVGPVRGEFALAIAWKITAPMILMITALHPATHRLLRAAWAKMRGN